MMDSMTKYLLELLLGHVSSVICQLNIRTKVEGQKVWSTKVDTIDPEQGKQRQMT